MKSLHTSIEELAIQEYEIVLEEVARAGFSKEHPSEVQVLNRNGEYIPVGLRGHCKFYIPRNVAGISEDAKKPFAERMRALSTVHIDDVDARCTRITKGDLSALLKESEQSKKTEIYNAYLRRYDEEYLVVIVGDITERRG